MKRTKRQTKKGFTLVELLVVIAIIAVLAGLAVPTIMKARKEGDKTQALNNAKRIAEALISFEQDQGSYPSDATRESLLSSGEELPEGDDANAYFAQLLVNGSLDTESIFYAKGVKGVTPSDDLFNRPEDMLAKGENGFGYVMDQEGEAISAKSTTPLSIAPLTSGGENPKFNSDPYNGFYVYGQADGSGKTGKIRKKDGIPAAKGRMDGLFTQGEDSIFGPDTIPVVKPPRGLE